MDAPEEELDIKLQKISGDLIVQFDQALRPFLRREDGTVRGRVRSKETSRLTSTADWAARAQSGHQLLDPFQELPQLLDPHLSRWVQTLADALVDHLRSPDRGSRWQALSSSSSEAASKRQQYDYMPLPTAVCKLLYALCKIRGDKVIVRFLSVETKWLELLLSALEESERSLPQQATSSSGEAAPAVDEEEDESAWWAKWTWEERYVVLLWLSHLFLAPFDLATISSYDPEDDDLPEIAGFRWPPDAPGITVRVLPLALKYLSSPGKERDAARALLVRVAMRRDMQELGILHELVQWSLFSIRPKRDEADLLADTPYYYIGVLSFLAGALAASTDTSDMDRYLTTVFYAVHNISSGADPASRAMASSALARKTMIKVIRSVAVLVLRKPLDFAPGKRQDMAIVETAIGFLLDSLADNDTPVRFAASKALSVITLRLEPELASQVVEAVLAALDRNVRWIKIKSAASPDGTAKSRDLASVDPLEWHGLMLTLSHLLYRRSPPAEDLSGIIQALLTGLSFERRGASGASIGTNVRDAACFGIWALARRYTTSELLAVPTVGFATTADSASQGDTHMHATSTQPSILQILATELIVTASLDPSSNIRRGSSAALQELVGRHPETVESGISVVQTVDYHAVALRARAVSQVSRGATRLWAPYGDALLRTLLGWRGVGDIDAAARRVAGSTFGAVAMDLALADPSTALRRFTRSVQTVLGPLKDLQPRQVEERHGLLLTLAAVLDSFPSLVKAHLKPSSQDETNETAGRSALEAVRDVVHQTLPSVERALSKCRGFVTRRPELVAEAGSRLVVASFPVMQSASFLACGLGERQSGLLLQQLVPGAEFIGSKSDPTKFSPLVLTLDQARRQGETAPHHILLRVAQESVGEWLSRAEQEVIEPASHAALVLLVFSDVEDRDNFKGRRTLFCEWAEKVRHVPAARAGGAVAAGSGFISALTVAHPMISHMEHPEERAKESLGGELQQPADTSPSSAMICEPILERWAKDATVLTRVAILQSLAGSDVLRHSTTKLLPMVAEGLDDYTTTARGDVGSLVRLQALKATATLWRPIQEDDEEGEGGLSDADTELVISTLFLRVLRLAAEKLDKVRAEAQATLALALTPRWSSSLRKSTFSSRPYYSFLLNLLTRDGGDVDQLHPSVGVAARVDPNRWMEELMAGFATAADAGHEDLVISSRAALSAYCSRSQANLDRACGALVRNLRRWTAPAIASGGGASLDRLLVPTLSIVAFLFQMDVFPRCSVVDYKALCLAVQRAAYKSGNVRKIEACVRVYGAVAGMLAGMGGEARTFALATPDLERRRDEGIREAKKRLGALLMHPWPRVRTVVVDELWVFLSFASPPVPVPSDNSPPPLSGPADKLRGVDWGTADKPALKALIDDLGLN